MPEQGKSLTPTHTHTNTYKYTLSPSPVNVWNKWLLQRRQCEHTTMSHLIGWLHENLFVLDRVCNNQPLSLREFSWPWMTAPRRTEQRRKSATPQGKDQDQWYRLNDNNGPTPQDQLNAPNSQSYLGQSCTSKDSSHLLSLLSDFFVVMCSDVTQCNFAALTQNGDQVVEPCGENTMATLFSLIIKSLREELKLNAPKLGKTVVF